MEILYSIENKHRQRLIIRLAEEKTVINDNYVGEEVSLQV